MRELGIELEPPATAARSSSPLLPASCRDRHLRKLAAGTYSPMAARQLATVAVWVGDAQN
jgi:hypothetical protein